MPGKRVQFDDQAWQAVETVMRYRGKSFQQLADEAFADLLKKHKQPVGIMAALKESVQTRARVTAAGGNASRTQEASGC